MAYLSGGRQAKATCEEKEKGQHMRMGMLNQDSLAGSEPSRLSYNSTAYGGRRGGTPPPPPGMPVPDLPVFAPSASLQTTSPAWFYRRYLPCLPSTWHMDNVFSEQARMVYGGRGPFHPLPSCITA